MKIKCKKYTESDVAHHKLNAQQPILVTFGRDVAERVCYRMVICYPTFLPRDSYAKRSICRRRRVCVCVCLSHSGIVSKLLKVG